MFSPGMTINTSRRVTVAARQLTDYVFRARTPSAGPRTHGPPARKMQDARPLGPHLCEFPLATRRARMRASGSKIIIKPRRSRQPEPIQDPSPTPEPEPADTTDHEVDAVDDDDGPSGSELPADSQREESDVEETFVDGEPKLSIRIRGRGRPPKGFGAPRPRGRPRGSGRGRGRPRGARTGPTGPIILRLPKRVEAEPAPELPLIDPVEDSVEPTPTPAPEDVEIVQPMGGGKPFRQVAGKVYIIENDELVTDDEPKGDEKIDSNGNLLGGKHTSISCDYLSSPTMSPRTPI